MAHPPRPSSPATHPYTRRNVLTALGAGLLASAVAPPLAAITAPEARAATTDVLLDGTSFASYSALEANWDYLYPWGSDHNGSARMVASSTDHSHVSVSGNVLTLEATPITENEGTSSEPPYLTIHYNSGAIHAKQQVLVNSSYPAWKIYGEFQAPSAKGTWPAFWLTGVNSWPPESDILEYKGTAQNWSNTYENLSGGWSNTITSVSSPGSWHSYQAIMTKVNSTDVQIQYYIDGSLKGTHTGANFAGKSMWIIINLQMEGSSGSPGPTGNTYYYARNIQLTRSTG